MSISAKNPLLEVSGLCKYYPVWSKGVLPKRIGSVRACDDVSFQLNRGETLGLVGESGSGKTTTGRTLLRAIEPTKGKVLLRLNDREVVDLARLSDKELRPWRQKLQMIFQDPYSSLNPRMTVGEIVGEPLLVHSPVGRKQRRDQVMAILERVGLKAEHYHRYPHAFSGGQRQRIGIARSLILRPELIVADEAVSALDVSVQAQIINLLQDLQNEFGMAYLFIAHDLSVVRHLCDRIAVMYGGRIVEIGPSETLFNNPRHPYTQALLSAIPSPDPRQKMTFSAKGEIADPANLPEGCAFHPRCKKCLEPCSKVVPSVINVDNVGVACHLWDRHKAEAQENKNADGEEA